MGTRNPQGVFHIDGRKDSAKTGLPTLTQVANDFILTTDGWVGIGNISPRTKMDLRSNSVRNAIGLGSTTLSAAEAGAGAKPVGAYNSGIPARSSSYLTNWTEILDADSGTETDNFDASNGQFKAPREGIYWAIFSIALQSGLITANESFDSNQIEAIWEVRDSSGQLKSKVKSAKAFPGNGTAEAGVSCMVGVHLKKGDSLRPAVWIDLLWDHSRFKPFNTNAGYNVLTIVEQ